MACLTALLSPAVARFLDSQRENLFRWMAAFGSPLFILFPTEFARNISEYKAAFTKSNVEGLICYAAKVNKSEAFLEAVVASEIGADVASLQELIAVLGHGLRGESIAVSGPEKSPELLLIAARQGCTIAIDTERELQRLVDLHKRAHLCEPVKVLIRLSGFPVTSFGDVGPVAPPERENSRFGMSLEQWPETLNLLMRNHIRHRVHFLGFSFHIDNHEISDRGNAIWMALKYGLEAKKLGCPFSLIDMGGGLPVEYIQRSEWEIFVEEYVASLSKAAPQVMFRNKDFGIRVSEGEWNRGHFYAHDASAFKAGFLSALLAWQAPDKTIISEILLRNKIKLMIEPGRSLLDQAGITVCRVKGLKQSSRGDLLLVLDMNISHMWDQVIGSEFAVDPLLIPRCASPRSQQLVECHLVGNLCLESDVLAWRKVKFSCTPVEGDLLVFPNTAGYQMDFIESRMHRLPLPQRLALFEDKGTWHWKLDDKFSWIGLMPSS